MIFEGQRISVFRTRSGGIFATQADCPHRGGPLADGVIAGRTVICPLHEFKFDLESGEPRGNSCAKVKTYPVEVDQDGLVWIRLCELGDRPPAIST